MSRTRMLEVVAGTEALRDLAKGLYARPGELATDSPILLSGVFYGEVSYGVYKSAPPFRGACKLRGGDGRWVSNVWRSGQGFRERRIASGFVMVESRNGLDYVRSDGTGTSEF